MATSNEYLEYILEQLSNLENITYKKAFGEYIIYINGKLAAYLCDDRLLVKPTKNVINLIQNPKLELPYEGGKPMVLIEDTDDKEFLTNFFLKIEPELSNPKNKSKK